MNGLRNSGTAPCHTYEEIAPLVTKCKLSQLLINGDSSSCVVGSIWDLGSTWLPSLEKQKRIALSSHLLARVLPRPFYTEDGVLNYRGMKIMLSSLTRQSWRNSLMILPRNQLFSPRMNHHKEDWTRYSSSILGSKRYQSTFSSRTLRIYLDELRWIPSILGRLAAAFTTLYMFSEYGIALTLCEGPSMNPTIRPYGELILIDRFSPRWRGIDGGCVGADRAKASRMRQDSWRKSCKQQEQAASGSNENGPVTSTDLYQWHEPRVPVNELPPAGAWGRLLNQVSTGISVGDVVVVQHPDREGTVCKRVLGLPGDFVIKPPASMRSNRNRGPNYQPGLLVIPDGHIWIEGDNSMNSADSRNYGPVPAALIVGRGLCRIWPLRGSAILQRGAPPRPPNGAHFSGSTILPAGYEGEEIVKICVQVWNKAKTNYRGHGRTR
jgi:signal peptidase I